MLLRVGLLLCGVHADHGFEALRDQGQNFVLGLVNGPPCTERSGEPTSQSANDGTGWPAECGRGRGKCAACC